MDLDSIDIESRKSESFVNRNAFVYAMLGLAIGYVLSFVFTPGYRGESILAYAFIALFRLPVTFIQQLYLDVALVLVPVLIAGLSGKLRGKTRFVFVILLLSIWASSAQSYSQYTNRRQHHIQIDSSSHDEFGLPVSDGRKSASYWQFACRSAIYSLDHAPGYNVDHYPERELGHFGVQNNLRFIIALIVCACLLSRSVLIHFTKPPEKHWTMRF